MQKANLALFFSLFAIVEARMMHIHHAISEKHLKYAEESISVASSDITSGSFVAEHMFHSRKSSGKSISPVRQVEQNKIVTT